jgi:hypothetical protein
MFKDKSRLNLSWRKDRGFLLALWISFGGVAELTTCIQWIKVGVGWRGKAEAVTLHAPSLLHSPLFVAKLISIHEND